VARIRLRTAFQRLVTQCPYVTQTHNLKSKSKALLTLLHHHGVECLRPVQNAALGRDRVRHDLVVRAPRGVRHHHFQRHHAVALVLLAVLWSAAAGGAEAAFRCNGSVSTGGSVDRLCVSHFIFLCHNLYGYLTYIGLSFVWEWAALRCRQVRCEEMNVVKVLTVKCTRERDLQIFVDRRNLIKPKQQNKNIRSLDPPQRRQMIPIQFNFTAKVALNVHTSQGVSETTLPKKPIPTAGNLLVFVNFRSCFLWVFFNVTWRTAHFGVA